MKKAYDLYGVYVATLEDARRAVEERLAVTLAAHESGMRGGEYYRSGENGGENLILQCNHDPMEDEPFESKFPGAKFILYVSESERPDTVLKLLTEDGTFRRLRHDLL